MLIGTTNMDAARPVIWDMGEIASSGKPGAINLFRRGLLASASIPGAFPPVILKVSTEGKFYDEMHAVGGVTHQVFLYPTDFNLKSITRKYRLKIKRRLFIIRNGKLTPDWSPTQDKLLPLAKRSISSLILRQGIGDIYQLFVTSRRDKLDFNLAYMPPDLKDTSKEAVYRKVMNRLYGIGYKLGRNGYPWSKKPPSLNLTR